MKLGYSRTEPASVRLRAGVGVQSIPTGSSALNPVQARAPIRVLDCLAAAANGSLAQATSRCRSACTSWLGRALRDVLTQDQLCFLLDAEVEVVATKFQRRSKR